MEKYPIFMLRYCTSRTQNKIFTENIEIKKRRDSVVNLDINLLVQFYNRRLQQLIN